jgi:hypothetical protein
MALQIKFIQKIILIFGLIFILILSSTNQLVPTEYLNTLCLSFLIHLFAFVLSFDLFKYLKIPFTFYFSFLSLFTYAISPFFVDQFDFQLGQLNFNVFENLNFGFIVFYLIYFINTYKKVRINKIEKLTVRVNKISYKKFKYSFLFLYVVSQFIEIPISAFNEYVEFFLCGLMFIDFLTGNNKFYENVFLLFFVLFISLKLLLSGLIYAIIYFSFFLSTIFIVYFNYSFRKILPVIIFLFSVFTFTIIFSSVKMQYRSLSSNAATLYEKSMLVKDLINEDLKFSYVSNEQKVKEGPIWRLSYPLSAFSQVNVMTPTVVPFWNGESYSSIIYKIIPRFLYPDKPNENMGQLFGHKYNFLANDNLTTSMNAPILTEAYMNFGYLGFYIVIIIMALGFSNLFFNMNSKLIYNNHLFNMISVIHIALLSVYFIQWESNFSMLLGKCLILYIFDMLIKKIVFTTQ